MKPPDSQRIAGLIIPSLLGIFLIGTSSFDLIPEYGVLNGKRVLEVLLLLMIFSATALLPGLRVSFGQLLTILPRWAVYSLALAGLAGVLSALRFPHPGYGLLEVAMLALMILGVFATAAGRRIGGSGFDRLALLIIIAIGLIAAVTETMGMLAAWISGFEFNYDIMLVRFFHPRFYNHLQTFSIPLIAALPFVFGSSRKLKLIAVVLIGLQWCLILVSGGRGSVVSLIAAFSLAALLFPSNRRAWLSIHVAGLILGVAIFFAALESNQSVSPGGGQFVSQSIGRPMAHTTGRTFMWEISWHQAVNQPWLGVGPARFACEYYPSIIAHPHNFPVTIMAEWGFPALVLIMLVSAWLGWGLIVKCRQNLDGRASSDILVAMLSCSIIAATVHALVSGVLIMPASQVMTVLVGGWAFGRFNIAVPQAPANRLTTSLTLTTAIALAALVSVFSLSEIQKIGLRTQYQNTQITLEPRYWQSGHNCSYFYEDN